MAQLAFNLKNLPHAEATFIYVLMGLREKHGKMFLQGKNHKALQVRPVFKSDNALTGYRPTAKFLNTVADIFPEFNGAPPLQVLESFRFKGLSIGAQVALLAFIQDYWPLTGCWAPSSPNEVLKMQSRGQRLVSIMPELPFTAPISEDKNALEFTIHDLEHATKYFGDPALAEKQKQLFIKLIALSETPEIQLLTQSDPVFSKDWDYLISDMNTDPQHAWYFFRATLLNCYKRLSSQPLKDRLNPEKEAEFSAFIQKAEKQYFDFSPKHDSSIV